MRVRQRILSVSASQRFFILVLDCFFLPRHTNITVLDSKGSRTRTDHTSSPSFWANRHAPSTSADSDPFRGRRTHHHHRLLLIDTVLQVLPGGFLFETIFSCTASCTRAKCSFKLFFWLWQSQRRVVVSMPTLFCSWHRPRSRFVVRASEILRQSYGGAQQGSY